MKVIVLLSLYLGLCFSAQAVDETEPNKKVVQAFYQMAFTDHKPKEAAEKYLSSSYKQHNPFVADGPKPFIDYFVPFFQKNPESSSVVKRVIVEDNFVVLHVHSKLNSKDPGRAVVDIFRVQDGKIVEHWDVAQPVPEKSANQNTMF